MAKSYCNVHWRFVDLMNLQFELLIHPANHGPYHDLISIYHVLISFYHSKNYTEKKLKY